MIFSHFFFEIWLTETGNLGYNHQCVFVRTYFIDRGLVSGRCGGGVPEGRSAK